MSLATTLMGLGIPAEPAIRLGYAEQVPVDGTGTTQDGAAPILKFNTNIACGTSVGDTAFILPADAELFQPYFVLNTTPEAALIYPPVGDTIDEGALNAPVSIEQDFARVFQRVEDGRWVSFATGLVPTGVQVIIAGTGIAVDNTNPQQPVVSNTGVLSVAAGTNVNITGTAQNPVINSANPGGTVTSVDMTVPTGLQVSGGPITVSGTFTVTYQAGYQGFTTAEAGSIATALQPADIGVTVQAFSTNLQSWSSVTRAAGFDTFVAAPSSANLRSLLTDETGTGLAYFQGGALGTPSSATLTNATGLPIVAGTTGTLTPTRGGTNQTTWATGDLLYASGANTLAKRTIGTERQALLSIGGVPAWTSLPFTQSYESAQQTITSAGSLTLAHGLSAQPKLIAAFLQCTTAELGYSVGDEVCIATTSSFSADNRGISIVPDATNLNIRYGSGAAVFVLNRKDTGVNATITNGSWRLVVRAWV